MRIAFVGKGGSGKSTIAAAFSSFLENSRPLPILVFDADLNMHVPELLGFSSFPFEKHLSNPKNVLRIAAWLRGENGLPELGTFRKTTPPNRKSNLLFPEKVLGTPLSDLAAHRNHLTTFVVGTYQSNDIGASCYHNNLAIFESILNHTDDHNSYVVSDMVAGVDAFAGTLHAQFDLTCIIVEPTKRSVDVFWSYHALAESAGISGQIIVIGNKVRDERDRTFITEAIPSSYVKGFITDDEHVRAVDRTGCAISFGALLPANQSVLVSVAELLESLPDQRNLRLTKLHQLHERYVSQAFISQRFGDLTSQIDTEFSFRQVSP